MFLKYLTCNCGRVNCQENCFKSPALILTTLAMTVASIEIVKRDQIKMLR